MFEIIRNPFILNYKVVRLGQKTSMGENKLEVNLRNYLKKKTSSNNLTKRYLFRYYAVDHILKTLDSVDQNKIVVPKENIFLVWVG